MKSVFASLVSVVIGTLPLACSGSPAAPSASIPLRAADFVGDYKLTVQIDAGCVGFESRRVWAYRAILEDRGYVSMHVLGGAFAEPVEIGQLYLQNNAQFRFVFNIHDELFERPPESPELLLYGGGDATGTGSDISGVIRGSASLTGRAGNPCTGSHSFALARVAG
jgi:hypothetical protein